MYQQYIDLSGHHLFAFFKIEEPIGIIGLKHGDEVCEIGHIAVSPDKRGMGFGTDMINYVCNHYSFTRLIAETDSEAVAFYRKNGFKILSLGEKYPGVERFHCEFKKEEQR